MKKYLAPLFILQTSAINYCLCQKNMEPLKMQHKVTGNGNVLVLVPGGLTGWVSWDPFVDHFSKDKKVIQVQLLNVQYGIENKMLPVNYSVHTESEALASTLSSLNLSGKADFIGWSFGGLVLLDYALNHPEKIKTLTLIEPPAIWILKNNKSIDANAQKMINFLSTVPSKHGDVTDVDLERFMGLAGFVKPGQSARDLPQWNTWIKFKYSLRNNSAVNVHTEENVRLRNFKAPVLLVKGTGSSSFLHQIIDAFAKEFPNSKVVEFPAGHAPHIVSREKFLNAFDSLQSK